MEKMVQAVRKERYIETLQSLKEKVSKVMRAVVWELCKDDIVAYIPELFRAEKVKPIIARSAVVEMVSFLPNYEEMAEKEIDMALNQINDQEFLSAFRGGLISCSEKERIACAKRILNKLDLAAAINLIQYVRPDNAKAMKVKLADTLEIPHGELVNQLCEFREEIRNKLSHIDGEFMEEIDLDATIRYIEIMDRFVHLFIGFPKDSIAREIAQYELKSMGAQKYLRQEDIDLAKWEEEENIQPGKLSRFLGTMQDIKKNLVGNTLLFADRSSLVIWTDMLKNNVRMEITDISYSPMFPESPVSAAQLFPNLMQYVSAKFTRDQLRELVRYFVIFADVDTLLSSEALNAIAYCLCPVLKEQKKALYVEWNTLVSIFRVMEDGEIEQIRKNAKTAKTMLYYFQKEGLVRYVGKMANETNPEQSLIRMIMDNNTIPTCVITRNELLIEKLKSDTLPLNICVRPWASRGLYPHENALARLLVIARALSPKESEKENRTTLITHEKKEGISVTKSGLNQKNAPAQKDASSPSISNRTYETQAAMVAVKQNAQQDSAAVLEEIHVMQIGECDIPKPDSFVLMENGTRIKLLKQTGQRGGEGTVYLTDRPDTVAKIYHHDKINQERFEKLQAMRRMNLSIPNVCWPTSILRDEDNRFVGFLMPAAPEGSLEIAASVFKLNGKRAAQGPLATWDRLSLVNCCIAVVNIFAKLHKQGVLMGDVNPRNMLVSKSDPSAVFFVDCDSYQVGKFNCPVGMPEFSSPEILSRVAKTPGGYAECPRKQEDELFSIATLLFQILMFGQSPFAAKNVENIADAVRGYQFAFKNDDNKGYDAPQGPYPMIWSNTPKGLKDLFADTFLGKATHRLDKWQNQLLRYRSELREGKFTRELLPRKYPSFGSIVFVDFVCNRCGLEYNMEERRFAELEKKGSAKYCRDCFNSLMDSKKRELDIICDGCGEIKTGTEYDYFLQQREQKEWYCKKCSTLRCASCRSLFEARASLVKRSRMGKYVWCDACNNHRKENRK